MNNFSWASVNSCGAGMFVGVWVCLQPLSRGEDTGDGLSRNLAPFFDFKKNLTFLHNKKKRFPTMNHWTPSNNSFYEPNQVSIWTRYRKGTGLDSQKKKLKKICVRERKPLRNGSTADTTTSDPFIQLFPYILRTRAETADPVQNRPQISTV
ncbi:UNVERIFIED_CONTAM: hypothetical protein K2H54_038802 [Gekko kuhli]